SCQSLAPGWTARLGSGLPVRAGPTTQTSHSSSTAMIPPSASMSVSAVHRPSRRANFAEDLQVALAERQLMLPTRRISSSCGIAVCSQNSASRYARHRRTTRCPASQTSAISSGAASGETTSISACTAPCAGARKGFDSRTAIDAACTELHPESTSGGPDEPHRCCIAGPHTCGVDSFPRCAVSPLDVQEFRIDRLVEPLIAEHAHTELHPADSVLAVNSEPDLLELPAVGMRRDEPRRFSVDRPPGPRLGPSAAGSATCTAPRIHLRLGDREDRTQPLRERAGRRHPTGHFRSLDLQLRIELVEDDVLHLALRMPNDLG